jgi:hypothetical protein
VALYRGDTVADARLVAASSDSALVAEVVRRFLAGFPALQTINRADDPVLEELSRARKSALRVIHAESVR